MTHVITQSCCNDAACVPVCPADCIHPAPDEPGFATAEMLWIDPDECIDCGACTDVCPVDAIHLERDLPTAQLPFVEVNGMLAHLHRSATPFEVTRPVPALHAVGSLRVAVVGTGPSALFACEELLARGPDVRVSLIDRLPVVGGLVRFGVSPDHARTKGVLDRFPIIAQDPRVRLHLDVEVGRHVELHELLRFHHAVVLAVGAASDRTLGIPGEELPGSLSAREVVAWYNGHPEHADLELDLSCERVVVIGNGNVALDVARVLTADPDDLARTDVAAPALDALRRSRVREVVVIGRRGPAQAAFTFPELIGLTGLEGVTVRATGVDPDEQPRRPSGPAGFPAALKTGLVAGLAHVLPGPAPGRTIELRFWSSPHAVLGERAVSGVRLGRNRMVDGQLEPSGTSQDLPCGLVLRSVGYAASPVAGVPFDPIRQALPHEAGRVVDPTTTAPVTGVYATGWAKRGASGAIGTNRPDARETVTSLLADHASGRLPDPCGTIDDFIALIRARRPGVIDLAGWAAIEAFETRLHPRRKLVSLPEMRRVAAGVTA